MFTAIVSDRPQKSWKEAILIKSIVLFSLHILDVRCFALEQRSLLL